MAITLNISNVIPLRSRNLSGLIATPDSTFDAATLQYATGSVTEYARLYSEQSAVRSSIGYVSRSMGRVPLHLYTRTSGNDRERVRDHAITRLLKAPASGMGYADWVEQMAVYYLALGEAFAWLVRTETGAIEAMLPLCPASVEVFGTELTGPVGFRYTTTDGRRFDLTRSDMLYLREAGVTSSLRGSSRLEAARLLLQAEYEALRARAKFHAAGSRIGGVLEQAVDGPQMTEEQAAAFAAQFDRKFSGAKSAGRVALLPAGLSLKELSLSASPKDAAYIESRQLTSEEVSNLVGLPGHLPRTQDEATLIASETIAPLWTKFGEAISRALLAELGDSSLFLEPQLGALLKADTVKRYESYRLAAGRPIMTANECRRLENLAPLPGGDDLVIPAYLNESVHGGAPAGGRRPGNVDGVQDGARNE